MQNSKNGWLERESAIFDGNLISFTIFFVQVLKYPYFYKTGPFSPNSGILSLETINLIWVYREEKITNWRGSFWIKITKNKSGLTVLS